MYPPEIGGIEIVTKEIAEIAEKHNYQSSVLTFSDAKKSLIKDQKGVRVIRLASDFQHDPVRISKIYHKTMRQLSKETDLIVFHFPSFQPELDLFFHNYSVYKICFYHADVVNRGLSGMIYNNIIVKRFLKKMDKIIVTSPNMIETSKNLKNFKAKIEIVPLFVDTEHFQYKEKNKRKLIQRKLKIENDDFKIISYIGRFGRYKGLDILIKSLSMLDKSIYLLLVGDGKQKKVLERLTNELGLVKRVLFVDQVPYDELPLYYSASDVFVLPSVDRGEAFGLVAIEALACGIPIITTKLGTGTTFHNLNGQTGLHVEPENCVELRNAIHKILDENWKVNRKELLRQRATDFSRTIFEERIIELCSSISFNFRKNAEKS